MSKAQHVERLKRAILNCDIDGARRAAEAVVKSKVDPVEAIEKGLAVGIREMGEKFHRYEVFLPHVVLAADAMTAAMEILEKALPKEKAKKLRVGTVVIGTVEGDLHDVGKNVVAMMLKSAGFDVHDLGKDVKTDTFIQKANEARADIIMASSLMTTTRPYQRELVQELDRLGLRRRFKIMVGGGPVTKEWADQIGADGWGKDATEAVKEATRLLGRSR